MPKVSVVVPTYNCTDFLVETLNSVFQQTFPDFEVLVVDDGSTDNTAEKLRQFGGRIRYFYQRNAGPATARNLALGHASGEYVAFLDADDIWAPEKLESQVAYLESHPDVGLVHTNFQIIDEAGNPLALDMGRGRAHLIGNSVLRSFETSLLISTVMVRKEWIFRVGLLDKWADPSDRDFWIRLAEAGCSFAYIPARLLFYRWRRESITKASMWRLLEGLAYTYRKYLAKSKRGDLKADPQVIKLAEDQLDEVTYKLSRHYRIRGQRLKALAMLFPLILRRPWRLRYHARLASILIPGFLLEKMRTRG